MSFRFKVLRVNHLKDVGVYILDGRIESGKVFVGSEGALSSDSSRRIRITGVGIVCGGPDPSIPLFIAPPDFPLAELEGAVIVGE